MADRNEQRTALADILPAETRDALRHLEIFARKTVEGMLHGAHRSRRKGVSTEFDHHKQYMPGDPIKHVDWKVTARHERRIFVKRYIEDTALSVRLVVDASASHNQATAGVSVWRQSARMAASLAYLVLRQRDSVGMVMTGSETNIWLPTSSTQTQLVRIMQALVLHRGGKGTDSIEQALRNLLDRESRRGIVILISDLMFPPETVRLELKKLQAKGHEVLVFQVRDPDAEAFPFNRWMQFDSLERPGVRFRVDTVPLKRFYLEEYRDFMAEWKQWARKQDIHFVTLRSDVPIETALATYLHLRAGQGGTV